MATEDYEKLKRENLQLKTKNKDLTDDNDYGRNVIVPQLKAQVGDWLEFAAIVGTVEQDFRTHQKAQTPRTMAALAQSIALLKQVTADRFGDDALGAS